MTHIPLPRGIIMKYNQITYIFQYVSMCWIKIRKLNLVINGFKAITNAFVCSAESHDLQRVNGKTTAKPFLDCEGTLAI